jgi:hypothetical protein
VGYSNVPDRGVPPQLLKPVAAACALQQQAIQVCQDAVRQAYAACRSSNIAFQGRFWITTRAAVDWVMGLSIRAADTIAMKPTTLLLRKL